MSKVEDNNFEPLELFIELCKIPHESGKCSNMLEWIKSKALEFGAKVSVDKCGNMLATKGNPRVCLQCHYDMVYVSSNQHFSVKPYLDNGYIKAKDSSLGADNGAALSCMLLAVRDYDNLECLFTVDEEIGMIGAKNIELDIQSKFIINCDSEDIDEIVCSCAGGYDIEASMKAKKIMVPSDYKILDIRSKEEYFVGGHSGIEIHKDIKNSIIELSKIAKEITESGGIVIEFSGGEKRNSIPVSSRLIIAIPCDFNVCLENDLFKVCNVDKVYENAFLLQNLIDCILSIRNGVISKDDTGVTLSSNIGIVKQKEDEFLLYIMGRGNNKDEMMDNLNEARSTLDSFGIDNNVVDLYFPWEKEVDNSLLNIVHKVCSKYNPNIKIKSIHAGLECGVLKQKYTDKSFISIGPTIHHPHSLGEEMNIESFKKFWDILCDILKTI